MTFTVMAREPATGKFGIATAIVTAVFAGVAWLNARAVKQLDARIAALDDARDQT